MLVYSTKRFLPVTVNTLVLKGNNENEEVYYYVHRDVYDQAIILSDRHKLESMQQLLPSTNNAEAIKMFYERAPKPINILASFLGLVEEGLELDMEVLTGALHSITSIIGVRGYIKLKQELRKEISFSLSIKEEYEMPWERFFMEAVHYDEREILNMRKPGYGVQNTIDPMMMQQMMSMMQSGNMQGQQVQNIAPQKVYESHANLAKEGEAVRSKEAGAHDTGDVVDSEDIVNNPDWTEASPGVWYNLITGDTAFIEDEETEKAEEKLFSQLPINKPKTKEEGSGLASALGYVSETLQEEQEEINDILNAGLQFKRRA